MRSHESLEADLFISRLGRVELQQFRQSETVGSRLCSPRLASVGRSLGSQRFQTVGPQLSSSRPTRVELARPTQQGHRPPDQGICNCEESLCVFCHDSLDHVESVVAPSTRQGHRPLCRKNCTCEISDAAFGRLVDLLLDGELLSLHCFSSMILGLSTSTVLTTC